MRPMKSLLIVAFVLGLAFISMGDSFLPKPLSTVSKNTRSQINQVLLGFMPNPHIKKPSEQHEAEVEEMEGRVKGKYDHLLDDSKR